MPAGQSDPLERRRRIAVKEEDLEELYVLVQGAPYANTVLDARASLAQQDLATTLRLIESARDRYQQSNKRILRQEVGSPAEETMEAQQQARRIRQQQDRCHSVLEFFDEVASTLRRMIQLRAGGKQADDAGAISATSKQLLQAGSAFRTEYEMARSTRVQLAAIQRFFSVKQVASPQDMVAGGLYFVRGKEHAYLIQLLDASAHLDELPICVALSQQRMKPIGRERFLEMGRRKSLVWLVPKEASQEEELPEMQAALSAMLATEQLQEAQETQILDVGDFSQLHDAAVRSGLVANADLITHVRDREFRRGEFQKAFQVLEGLFGKFSGAATQRDQRLRREDVEIASGKLRMSPKALMEKRARDTAESQRVDRARNRFLRVLEGLRVLMLSE